MESIPSASYIASTESITRRLNARLYPDSLYSEDIPVYPGRFLMETSMTRSGYLISVSSENSDSSEAVPDAVTSLISKGFYATLFSEKWNSSIPSTLGDYLTMKAGDNVYFMCKRIIYGIGEIVQMFPGDAIASFELQDGATTTKYHPDSCLTTTAKAQGNETKTKVMRWGIIFKASPYFFKTGVDMDDMLASNPSAFRSLRTFWKKSFIQFDEVENSAFRARYPQQPERATSRRGKRRLHPLRRTRWKVDIAPL